MARNLGPVCRLCRREGLKLFLKGERCYSDKCAIERRNYPPGAHGQARTRFSEFAIRLLLLERRLDNVVYRLGFASSLAQARQVVRHGHILVNGKKVTIPSTLVEVGSVISVAEASRTKKVIVEAIEMAQRRGVPPWMALEREQFRGSLRALPARAELTMPISEKLIVEHYSR
jgi:small subunit ribosomal protein S4